MEQTAHIVGKVEYGELVRTREKRADWVVLAEGLLEYETLSGEEINSLLETGKIDRPDAPRGPAITPPVRGSAIPKAGKRFGGKNDEAPQGA